jgi:hypothetical protein
MAVMKCQVQREILAEGIADVMRVQHVRSRGRNIQQSRGPMPLFTVAMKPNGSNSEKDRLSKAIHSASIAAGYPEEDLFQRFLSLGPSDLRVDLYYPALPKPRTDQMLMIEVLVSSGTATNRKKCLVAALVQKFGEAGIDPSDIMVDMAACWIACCSKCGTSSRIVL